MQKFKIQVKNCRRKKFFRVKSTFFQKKSHILSTLARCLLLWLAENKKFSGWLKILRSEQLLFQRSKRKNNCGRESGEFELQFQRSWDGGFFAML